MKACTLKLNGVPLSIQPLLLCTHLPLPQLFVLFHDVSSNVVLLWGGTSIALSDLCFIRKEGSSHIRIHLTVDNLQFHPLGLSLVFGLIYHVLLFILQCFQGALHFIVVGRNN